MGANRPQNLLREESVSERQKNALDEIAHLVEDCDNRLSLKTLDFAKRYVEGRLGVNVKFRSRSNGEVFNLTWYGWPSWDRGVVPCRQVSAPRVANKGEVLASVISLADAKETDTPSLIYKYGDQFVVVLVGPVEFMKGPQQEIPSLVGLSLFNKSDCVGRQELFLFGKCGFEMVSMPSEWEACTCCGASFFSGYGSDHLIQRGSEVVKGLSYQQNQISRHGLLQAEAIGLLLSGRVYTTDALIIVRLPEMLNEFVDLVDLGFGPFDLGEGREKRFKLHAIDSQQ